MRGSGSAEEGEKFCKCTWSLGSMVKHISEVQSVSIT